MISSGKRGNEKTIISNDGETLMSARPGNDLAELGRPRVCRRCP